MSTVASRARTMAVLDDETRFDREVAMLVGIVEPDHAAPASAAPSSVRRSSGWLVRLARSRSGSVALGFGIAAAIGGVVAIGVRSLPAPVAVEPASVTLAVPAIDRPVVPAAMPSPVARQDDVPVPQPERVGVRTPARPAQLAMARSRSTVARHAPTPQAAPSPASSDDARPVMVAAVDRTARAAPAPRTEADDAAQIAAATLPSNAVTMSERRDPPALRAERRDNIDALRQLRHQW